MYAAADQAMRPNLAVLGGLLLLTLGFAWGFGYLFVLRRVDPLMRATARLAVGDLAARVGLTEGPEELGQLAQAFDRMAASLEEREAPRRQAEEALGQSEKNFRSLYIRTPVMLHSIDPEGKIISVSDYWLETMGYGREEGLGWHIGDFLTAQSRREALEVNLPRLLQTGWVSDLEYQFVKKSGEIMDVLLSAIVEKDAAGAMVRTMGVVVDVTARQRAEAALQESEALLRESQRIAHIGSWSINLTDQTITWSAEMYRIYGVTKEEFPHTLESFMKLLHPDVVGKKVSEVIPGLRESNPEMFEIFGRVALTGNPERFEIYLEALLFFSLLYIISSLSSLISYKLLLCLRLAILPELIVLTAFF